MKRTLNNRALTPIKTNSLIQAKKKCRAKGIKYRVIENILFIEQSKQKRYETQINFDFRR